MGNTMFANQNHRRDFADTCSAESALSLSGWSRFDSVDSSEQLVLADAADSHLLRMVMCVACATITLALVSSFA